MDLPAWRSARRDGCLHRTIVRIGTALRARVGLASFAGALLLTACGTGPERPNPMDQYWNLARTRLEPGMSDEAKAVAIARWVAENSTNQPQPGPNPPLVPFYGLCGERATVFLQLARRADLRVERLQFDRLGPGPHAAVQAHYDDDWHYFDVTYAGYFEIDDKILSLAEIRANAEEAVSNMVVFDSTYDRWADGTAVDNHQRMDQVYTPGNIRRALLKDWPPTAGDG